MRAKAFKIERVTFQDHCWAVLLIAGVFRSWNSGCVVAGGDRISSAGRGLAGHGHGVMGVGVWRFMIIKAGIDRQPE